MLDEESFWSCDTWCWDTISVKNLSYYFLSLAARGGGWTRTLNLWLMGLVFNHPATAYGQSRQ